MSLMAVSLSKAELHGAACPVGVGGAWEGIGLDSRAEVVAWMNLEELVMRIQDERI
jgi:hypothetical protein